MRGHPPPAWPPAALHRPPPGLGGASRTSGGRGWSSPPAAGGSPAPPEAGGEVPRGVGPSRCCGKDPGAHTQTRPHRALLPGPAPKLSGGTRPSRPCTPPSKRHGAPRAPAQWVRGTLGGLESSRVFGVKVAQWVRRPQDRTERLRVSIPQGFLARHRTTAPSTAHSCRKRSQPAFSVLPGLSLRAA